MSEPTKDLIARDRDVMMWLAIALETMDAAIGRPYEAAPMRTRTTAWLTACRQFPREAIVWATETACSRLERYPSAAQFRALCQSSPAWRAKTDTRAPIEAPLLSRCPTCHEPRAYHRVKLYADAPRPLAMKVIRHKQTCEHFVGGMWVDPAAYDTLDVNDEAWRAFDGEWTPERAMHEKVRRAEPTAPVSTPSGETLVRVSDAERKRIAQQFRDAAAEIKHDEV